MNDLPFSSHDHPFNHTKSHKMKMITNIVFVQRIYHIGMTPIHDVFRNITIVSNNCEANFFFRKSA